MARKPGRMYREIRGQAYTRREFMGGIPSLRIAQFEMGDAKGDFPVEINLIAEEQCQIRNIALEAARIVANRFLLKRAGAANYFLKMRVYPHHVLRENKQATGAGADRVSDGMRRAFGKAVGTASRVQRGQRIFTVRTTLNNVQLAKEALRKASMKLPTPCRIEIKQTS